jgi:hypothetical protein
MGDSKDNRTGKPPGSAPGAAPGRSVPPTRGAPAAPEPKDGRSGRVVHDERGNAVWHWVKETSRIAIESTSRLLRRLEVPELKVEETQDEELRIESDRDAGGGYDPYGNSSTNKRGKR